MSATLVSGLKERPIIMPAESVNGILAGRKMQMRRLIEMRQFGPSSTYGYEWTFRDRRGLWNDYTTKQLLESKWCQGHVGDRLWVREAFALAATCADPDPDDQGDWYPCYRANGDERPWLTSLDEDTEEVPPPWRSPLFMPRWASRITLKVTEVRVQRLQEIREEDAKAEGVEPAITTVATYPSRHAARREIKSYRDGYATAWDRTNAKRATWASNPWIWALTFQRVTQ